MKVTNSKTIYLIRHGQTEGNANGDWLGARSINELNNLGRKQALDVVESLKKIDVDTSAIFSSPTPRALQTAEIIQKHFGTSLAIKKFHSLTEINLGLLEDKTREQGIKLLPEEIDDWENNLKEFDVPLGESALEACERFYETITFIAQNYPQKDIVVVTHGVVIKLFLAKVLKKSIERGEAKIEVPLTTHGSIAEFSFNGKYFSFKQVIENSHPDSEEIASFG